MNNMKSNFGFSAIAVGAFALALGLAACGDGGSTNGPSNDDDSSSSRIILSSSSSVISDTDSESSSSSSEKDDSSSSVAPSSSSVILSSSSEESSSSVASSSSEESSSSITSSSSVASSSSSSVIPGTDPGSSSSKANWAYLNPDIEYGEFTDERDGQVYKTVTIGSQTWMAENLNYSVGPGTQSWCGGSKYNDKFDINNPDDFMKPTKGECDKYGRLYIWDAAMNACPDGWYLPGNAEWVALFNHEKVDGESSVIVDGSDVGNLLRSKSNLWKSSAGIVSLDKFGFSALPAGSLDIGKGVFNGLEGNDALFWSSSESSENVPITWHIAYNDESVGPFSLPKQAANSVRCVLHK